MRTVSALLLLGLVTGCTPKELALTSMTPLSFDAALSCASTRATQLGYTVVERKAPGEVYAEKTTRTVTIEGVGRKVIRDHLTVTVSKADGAIRTLQVTGGTEQAITVRETEQRRGLKTSDQVRADAGTVMAACKKQPGSP